MQKICLECFSLEEFIAVLKSHFVGIAGDMNTIPKNELLSRKQAAEKLKITLPTLGQWTKDGRITSYRQGSRIYYKEDEILASLDKINHVKYKRL